MDGSHLKYYPTVRIVHGLHPTVPQKRVCTIHVVLESTVDIDMIEATSVKVANVRKCTYTLQ